MRLNTGLAGVAQSPSSHVNVTCALADNLPGAISTKCEDEVVVSSQAAPRCWP